jgi:hypothetical protein
MLLGVALGGLSSGAYGQAVRQPEVHLNEYLDGMWFKLDIVHSEGDVDRPLASKLTIQCETGCPANNSYAEQFDPDFPLGALVVRNELVTLWSTASSDWVRIYHVSPRTITKVLDVRSKGQAPAFVAGPNGRPAVVVGTKSAGDIIRETEGQDSKVKANTFPAGGEMWVWNGSKYQMSH